MVSEYQIVPGIGLDAVERAGSKRGNWGKTKIGKVMNKKKNHRLWQVLYRKWTESVYKVRAYERVFRKERAFWGDTFELNLGNEKEWALQKPEEEGTAFSKTQRKKWFGYLKSIKQINISEVKWERKGEEESKFWRGREASRYTVPCGPRCEI